MRDTVLAAGMAAIIAGLVAPGLSARQAPAGRNVQIQFDMQGRVTLIAENATVREILAEWGRVGGSHIVNAEGLAGGPLPSLRFEGRPEREVINSLLQSAAGYILGPRTVRTSGPSLYETVMILPTSTPTSSGFAAGPASNVPARTPGAPESEIPPVTPVVGVPVPEPPPPPAQNPTVNPGPGVFVPIVPVTPVPTGRGRGGGGG